MYDLRNGTHANSYLQSAFNKHGYGAFHFALIEHVSIEELGDREVAWINCYDARNMTHGFNIAEGGSITHGMAIETRMKLSAIRTGVKHSLKHNANISIATKGKKRSPKHCEHLREWWTSERRMAWGARFKGKPKSDKIAEMLRGLRVGTTLSADHRAKVGEAGKGRPVSQETRDKVRRALTGRTLSAECKAKISLSQHRRLGT